MAAYKLIKNTNSVQVLKDDQPMSLYRDIHDLGIEVDGWGGFPGPSDQIAFALIYDHTKNVETALNKYTKIVALLQYAAPMQLDLSSEAIEYLINQ